LRRGNSAAWDDAIGSAGYPAASLLPPDWQGPPARPLAEAGEAPAATPQTAVPAAASAP